MKATEYGDVSLSLDLNDVLSDISLDVNIGSLGDGMLEEALQLGSRSDTHQIVAKDKNYHALSTSSVLPSLNLPQPPTSQPSPINISQPQLSPVNISQAQPLPSTITTHPTASLPLPNSQQSPGVPVPPAPVANTTWQPSLRKTLPLDTNSPSKRLEHTTSTSLEAPATPSKNTPPPSPQTNHPADSQVAHSAPLPSKAENMLRPQPQTEHLPAQSAVPPAAPTALPTKQILDSARETLPSPQAGHELDHILRESDSFEVGQIDIDAILSAIRNEQLRTVHSATPGVLKIDPMHRIASTLSSPTMKKEAGLPTSLCITSFIAIGMSHGVVLVFDLSENLRIIIGGTQVSEYGPVTSIDAPKGIIARDQAGWLLCGYQSGHVALWDVVSGKLLKIVNDAHSLPVLWVKFAGDNHRSLTVDSQGNMQLHDFTSRFFGINNEHVLVLSGKQIGVILSLEVLPSGFCSHATDTHCLFAFCTNQKVHLMGLGSGLSVKICQKTKLKKPESSPPGAIPYLAWRRACPPSNAESGNKVLDPILAVGWGLNIRLLQTVEDVIKGTNPEELNGIEFIAVGDYDIGTQINGLSWLGPEAIVMLGDNDVIRVWDPFSATFIESASSRKMELVYHSRIVHPSTKKPELSFSNCIFSTHKHVYLMGLAAIHKMHLQSWEECIESLVTKHMWQEALSLTLDIFQGRAKITLGLPQDIKTTKIAATRKMQELLTAMLNRGLVLPGTKPMQASLLPAIFTPAALAQLCINFCLEIGCVDFLFQSLYPLFLTNKVHYSFLMHLIPFILESKINNLPPKILDNLFEFCISQSRKQLLEQCIYHLNPASLQDSKVLSLCREQKLVGCLFYLYGNLPNSDYTTPLRDVEDLLPLLREHKHIGALVLKYISSCLLGLCFQTNTPIPPAKLYDLRVEVTRYLFIPLLPPDPREFPRLYYLAKFDTATLLKALVPTYNLHTVIAGTPLSCQRMAEILINVIVDKNMIATPSLFGSVSATASSRHDFTVEQQGHLFAFLARYFSKDIITLPPAILSLILHGYLCSPHVLKPFQVTPSSSVSAADLRLQNEQILTEMLPKLLKSSYDVHKLLLLAEGVEFFSVAERIYMHLQNFPKVISTRLKNPQEKTAAFELIQKLYENSALTERQKLDIKASVMQNLPALLQIDSNRLSQLVIEFFAADYQQVLLQLADQPQLQHSFLEQIMSQEGKKMLEKNGIRIAPETHVLYLTLLCQYSSDSVLGYLSSCDDYPLDECIKIVQKHKLMDAELFLLERTGDLSAALTRMIQTIGSQIEGLKLFYRQLHSTSSVQVDQVFPVHTEEKQLTSSLNRAITLCQRNTNRLQDSEVESLWFTLLDTVIIPLRSLKHNKWAAKKITASSSESVTLTAHEASNRSMLKALTYLTNLILTNMMGNVKLTLLLQKIVRDHGKDEFGDLKLVILGVLETYAYETEILKTAQSLLLKDVYYATDSLLRHQQRPLTPKSPNCAMCGRSLLATQNQQVPDTVVFGCGHAVHFSCNPFSESCHLCAQSVKTKKEKPLHPAPRPTSNSTIPAPGVTVSAPAAQASKWQMETYLNRLSRISTSRCLTGITTPDDDDTGKATPKPVFLPKTTAPKMIYRTTPLDPPMYIRSLLENEQNP